MGVLEFSLFSKYLPAIHYYSLYVGAVLGMADIACLKITFQCCNELGSNRKGRHTVHIDLVSKGKERPRDAKLGKEGVPLKCLADAKAKKERGWMFDKETSGPGEE